MTNVISQILSIRCLSVCIIVSVAIATTITTLVTCTFTAQEAIEVVARRYVDSQVSVMVTNLSSTLRTTYDNNMFWVDYLRAYETLPTLTDLKGLFRIGATLNQHVQVQLKNGNYYGYDKISREGGVYDVVNRDGPVITVETIAYNLDGTPSKNLSIEKWNTTYNPLIRPWYVIVINNTNDAVWSSPSVTVLANVAQGTETIYLKISQSCTLRSWTGEFFGVVVTSIAVDYLNILIGSIEMPSNSIAFFAENKGRLLACSRKEVDVFIKVYGKKEAGASSALDYTVEPVTLSNYGIRAISDLGNKLGSNPLSTMINNKEKYYLGGGTYYIGVDRVIVYGRNLDWVFVLMVPQETLMKDVVRGRTISIIVAALILFVAIILAFIFSYGISRPLNQMALQMTSILRQMAANTNAEDLSSLYEIRRIQTHFNEMAVALSEYKKYLPEGLFDSPPEGEICLAFTDVQESTMIWEKDPEGMHVALMIHNNTLRELIEEHNGYEVKTEGDSFMVAFHNTLDAAKWCLCSQIGLLNAEWPDSILKTTEASEQYGPSGEVLWRGLKVRMGFNTGSPHCEWQTHTSRMDYFGPMVNLSARIMSVGKGGQIVCSDSTFIKIEPYLSELKCFKALLGPKSLKGISKTVNLICLYPITLSNRFRNGTIISKHSEKEKDKDVHFIRYEKVEKTRHSSKGGASTIGSEDSSTLPSNSKSSIGVLVYGELKKSELTDNAIIQMSNHLMNIVDYIIPDTKGTINAFGMGWFLASWNITNKSPKCAENAVNFAIKLKTFASNQEDDELHASLLGNDIALDINLGIWMGPITLGKVGSAKHQTITLSMNAFEEVKWIARFNTHTNTNILANRKTMESVSSYNSRLVDIIQFQQSNTKEHIYEILQQLPSPLYMEATKDLISGSIANATTKLQQYVLTSKGDLVAYKLLASLKSRRWPDGSYVRNVIDPWEQFTNLLDAQPNPPKSRSNSREIDFTVTP